jgi:hypothetical protein
MDGARFVDVVTEAFPAVSPVHGKQAFSIAGAQVWLMGSSQSALKGDALLAQEDQFLVLGEEIEALPGSPGPA